MYGPAMQCNSKSYYQTFQLLPLARPNLCPQPKSSLINHLINDRLSARCLTNHPSDVASTHQHLAQNFNRSTPVALPRFCSWRTKVWNVREVTTHKLGRRYQASRDKAARWFACTVPSTAVLLKLKLVPRLWLYKQYGLYGYWEIYWSICVPS